jgi:hypothetical protein
MRFKNAHDALQLDVEANAPAPPPRPALNRSDFAVGDTVSFEGRNLIAHVGTIVRLPVLLIYL